jgi:hypothetical protein
MAKDDAIIPEKNEFDDHFLDVTGATFKFDHAKGLAEWIKNSADAYSTTARVRDDEQHILLRFKQGNPKRESVFECIDFVGMTRKDIDKAVKVWGKKDAAKKGTDLATYGGHGNGGKFYMRQMFQKSRFITFRSDLLNVFGFDEKRRYGYARGYIDREMSLEDAMKFASIDNLEIPDDVKARWKRSPKSAGFTVVRGERPEHFSGRSTIHTILDRLRLHPQARRLVQHKQVCYLSYNETRGKRLEPPVVSPREGFEEPRVIDLPRTFEFEGEEIEFRNRKHPNARLTLYTSAVPMARSGDLAGLNTIDILGEIGCIGSYRMNELGFMRYGPESEFIYGECECRLLEDEEVNSVTNDRDKLAENPLTHALLEWIRQQVDALAAEMTDKTREEKKARDLRESSLYNQILDKWKNRFMAKLNAELFGGAGIGGSFGGAGGGADLKIPRGDGGGGDGAKNTGDVGDGGGSGDEPRKGPRFPRVFLSEQDLDPLDPSPNGPFHVDERQPPIYQRDVDINHGIYWINTERPLANKLLDKYGASNPRWREYLFQRYVDIILKQSVYELAKREGEFTDYRVDQLIDDVTSRVHDAAAQDLEQFLFEDSLTGASAAPRPVGDGEEAAAADEAPAEGALQPQPAASDPKTIQKEIRELQKAGFTAEQIRWLMRKFEAAGRPPGAAGA